MPRFLPASAVVAAIVLVAAAAPARAQSAERVLYASVLDKQTKAPVDGLGPADFRVTEDDRAREILSVTPAKTPMPVAIVVDNQAAAQATIADLRNALGSFLTRIDGVGPIAIVTTADRPTILQDYTTDSAKLRAAVNRIFAQPDSGATLLDAIPEVSRGLARREEDRAAIVLISLERTEFSTQHFSQVLDRLKESGASMHAVVLRNQANSLQSDAARNRAVVLDRGVEESGGIRVDVLTSMSYGTGLAQVADALTHQYRIVYARPESLIPPERVTVRGTRDGHSVAGHPARGQKER